MRWKTKDGKKVDIEDLDDLHLSNLSLFLQRRIRYFRTVLGEVEAEEDKRILAWAREERGPYPQIPNQTTANDGKTN